MKKFAISILALTLVFLIVPGVFAQSPVSAEADFMHGGGVMTDGVDSLYFSLETVDFMLYFRGELRVEKSAGLLIIGSREGPVLNCRVKDADVNCGEDSTLTCEDDTEITVNDSEDTLSFDGVTYNLERGILECQSSSRP